MPAPLLTVPDEGYVTLSQASRLTGFGRERLRVAVADGRLPAFSIGSAIVIARADLERFASISEPSRRVRRAAGA